MEEKTFREFLDKKNREGLRHLKIIKKLLEKNGFTVDDFLDDDDAYIFLNATDDRLSFGGLRIYQIGDIIAYRVQQEKDTHPYGTAYQLDINGMFNDLMSETGDEKKSGKKVIQGVVNEFKSFFEKSLDAQKNLKSRHSEIESDTGQILTKSNDVDYATLIHNRI